ncbi:MAG: Ribonucleoside-diphosphate reductase subunit beta [Candidatus Anoxychlamydiales bacterium]|nr:Ribonucleoside-diphosphate reductase subunit beta [Candidatus Anoxychlamydiales bacterium]
MEAKKLFNPSGNDSIQERQIINGNTTNIFNLNNVKYPWANKLYRIMMENFWIPEKVDLSSDMNDYKNLTDDEKRAFDGILSFLIFLDSLQTNNIPHISDYITSPEINLILAIQTYQEAIHSQSYQYIIESILPKETRNYIYDYWRDDKVLFERNKYIASVFQKFLDSPSKDNFKKALIANYLLEGLYFYNGFNFFYNLASRHKMHGTSDIIKYINRDELLHVVIFKKIIPEVIEANDISWIHEMFHTAVNQEITWTNHIIGNNILGISKDATEKYTKYLANSLLEKIHLKHLYPGFVNNPYQHLEKIADTEGKGDVKANFFEATVTSYNQSSAIDGWDF